MSFAAFEPARYARGRAALRGADEPDRDGAVGRPQLDGIRPCKPGRGIPRPPTERSRLVHGGAGAGDLSAEWFSIEGRERIPGEETTVESPAGTSFSAPSEASSPAVLYLKRSDASSPWRSGDDRARPRRRSERVGLAPGLRLRCGSGGTMQSPSTWRAKTTRPVGSSPTPKARGRRARRTPGPSLRLCCPPRRAHGRKTRPASRIWRFSSWPTPSTFERSS